MLSRCDGLSYQVWAQEDRLRVSPDQTAGKEDNRIHGHGARHWQHTKISKVRVPAAPCWRRNQQMFFMVFHMTKVVCKVMRRVWSLCRRLALQPPCIQFWVLATI